MENIKSFKQIWLSDIDSNASPTEKGKSFLEKFIADWLDPTEAMLADSVYCDGPGDGGIDFAILINGEDREDVSDIDEPLGNTWYLIQSKYGAAFNGVNTLWEEAQKIFKTLRGDGNNLSTKTKELVNRLHTFIKSADPERDRLVLVFALIDDLDELTSREIEKIRNYGRDLFGKTFNINGSIFESSIISLDTIYNRNIEEAAFKIKVKMRGNLTMVDDSLLIGSTSIVDFYDFLNSYRSRTNDLDHIFEKNVRKSLGGNVKVNKGIRSTLQAEPEKFGLFNNGITIAVNDFKVDGGLFELANPYIVNGCQTTSSIWSVCDCILSSGASIKSKEVSNWEARAKSSHVIIKIVKIGEGENDLLQSITRFTNSQNAVRDRDFIALSNSFQSWRGKFKSKWKIFLEIQKGGWDAEKSKNFGIKGAAKYKDHANAVELMKVYGAGWLQIPGIAYGKNAPFVPGGHIYKDVTNNESEFDETDLYAAYLLLKSSENQRFGRQSEKESRRQTKYLYCFLSLYLLRSALENKARKSDNRSISKLIVNYHGIHEHLIDGACEIIDIYMRPNDRYSIDSEKNWKRSINYYLKSESFGKNLIETENLSDLLNDKIRSFKKNGFFVAIVDEMDI